MTGHKQEGCTEKHGYTKLLEIATPQLYRQNAFRALSLPVDVTMRDVKRQKTKLDMMRKSLNLEEDLFLDKIYDWAKKYSFSIDGDYLTINRETMNDFIISLDKQFSTGEIHEETGEGKIDETKIERPARPRRTRGGRVIHTTEGSPAIPTEKKVEIPSEIQYDTQKEIKHPLSYVRIKQYRMSNKQQNSKNQIKK